MSIHSFNKQSTLQSIPEVPGEQNNPEMENNLKGRDWFNLVYSHQCKADSNKTKIMISWWIWTEKLVIVKINNLSLILIF